MTQQTPPSAGERRALTGITAQYQVAAQIVYDALLEDQLDWVRFIDIEGGRVDDLQVAAPGRLDAYQVKWSEFPSVWTFRDLTREAAQPSLIKQLADGWKRLRVADRQRVVHVHLLSNNLPSPNRQSLPLSDPPPPRPHLAGFLRDAWSEVSAGRPAPQGWLPAVDALREAAGLSPSEFADFCQVCHFDLNFRLEVTAQSATRTVQRRSEDIRVLSDSLLDAAATLPPPVQLGRKELLERVGWLNRFQPRFRHEFPIDLSTYQPIEPTVQELERCLEEHSAGYIALIGSPGSGKSTTLQATLRYRPGCRLIKYYCFVRDDPALGRGEANYFLNDLVLHLHREGIGRSQGSLPSGRDELLSMFQAQLGELHERWQRDGERTVIMIDGLDHIEREQQPERSLLADLPLPQQVPDGVLIVLGTQTLELENLSPRIQQQASRGGRLIRIGALSRSAIRLILDSSKFPIQLSEPEYEEVCRLSDGHPLALYYLVKRLRSLSANEDVQAVLTTSEMYSGDIEDDYRMYWHGLAQDPEARELLGLLCRLRMPVRFQTILPQAEQRVLHRLLEKGRQYFTEDREGRNTFFHNSFRQFVLIETAKNALGLPDGSQNEVLHRRAATLAAKAPTDSPFHWEQLFHLWKANDHAAVIQLGSQDWFRQQFMAFRALNAITEDLSLLLHAAREEKDGVAVVRALLVEHEVGNRAWVLEQIDLPRLLLQLRDPEVASAYCLNGKQITIGQKEALQFAEELASRGHQELAASVFNAAEPLGILNGTTALSEHWGDEHELLTQWAIAARWFLPLQAILDVLAQVRFEYRHNATSGSPDVARDELIDHALITLAKTLAESKEGELLDELCDLSSDRPNASYIADQGRLLWCLYHPASSRARQYLDDLTEGTDWSNCAPEERLLFVESVWAVRRDPDEVGRLIEDIPQPPIVSADLTRSHRSGLGRYAVRIHLNHLLTASGNGRLPEEAVPSHGAESAKAVAFERALVRLANARGAAERGDVGEPGSVLWEIRPALLLYDRHGRHDEYREEPAWSSGSLARDLFSYLVRAVNPHGHGALALLAQELELMWQRSEDQWPIALQRDIAVSLETAGLSKQWLIDQLERLESRIDIDLEIDERMDELAAQCQAWIQAGQKNRAEKVLDRIVQGSFGVYYRKDIQFPNLSSWLAKATEAGVDDAAEHIRLFASATAVIGRNQRGEMSREAATTLVEAATSLEPSYGLVLGRWLMDRFALRFTDGVSGLLLAALSSEEPPIRLILATLRRVVVPLSDGVREVLCEKAARTAVDLLGPGEAESELIRLGLTIDTKAFPTSRRQWYQSIKAGALQAGAEMAWLDDKTLDNGETRRQANSEYLLLDDGSKMSVPEVGSRISSPADLEELLANASPNQNTFPWDEALKHLLVSSERDDLLLLERQLDRLDCRRCDELLADRYLELGQSDGLKRLGAKLLAASKESGWLRRWDGGSRLDAYRLLFAADPERYGPAAFEGFLNDYLGTARNPTWLVQQLDEMVPVPLGDLSVLDLWPDLAEHASQLYEFNETGETAPSLPEESISYASMLVTLLFELIVSPISELQDEAFRAASEVLAERCNDTEFRAEIEASLAGERARLLSGLALLERLSDLRPDFILGFKEAVSRAAASNDFVARRSAQRVLDALACQIPQPARYELPPAYILDLPPLRELDAPSPVTVLPLGASTPDTRDPIELTSIIHEPLGLLASRSGLPFQNVVYRASALMSQLLPENEWDKAAEERLKAWCRSSGLETPFQRPRAAVAFTALSRVAAELVDAGRIDELRDGDLLDAFTRVLDGSMAPLDPAVRPHWMSSPFPDDVEWYEYAARWKEDARTSLGHLRARLPGDYIVLGESTVFQRLEWSLPTERRFSLVCHPDYLPSEPPREEEFFLSRSEWRAFAYPSLRGAGRLPVLVVKGEPRQIEFGRQEWLAFNPGIAGTLGWHPDVQRPFGWINDEGHSMVHSFWWQDGPQGRHPPSNEVCSSGWLVLATRRAAQDLEEKLRHMHRVRGVRRDATGNSASERGSSHAMDTNPQWDEDSS